jgi:hypothetical protein
MKKLTIRVLGVGAVLAFAASVAAAEAPLPQSSSTTLSCTKSGMTCGSSGQCCSHSCAIPHGRVVGRCN